MMDVALMDYGAGNHHSLKKGLEAGGARVFITSSWDEALAADTLVLPGVGSFGAAVKALDGEADRVRAALEEGLPALGICLGMQLLFSTSEEAPGAGIGLIPGRVRRIRARTIPQMGWNDVEVAAPEDPILREAAPLTAYFANSFVCEPAGDEGEVLARTRYEDDVFPVGVRRGNTWGLQFHPEKSSAGGLGILARWVAEASRLAEGRRAASAPAEPPASGDTFPPAGSS